MIQIFLVIVFRYMGNNNIFILKSYFAQNGLIYAGDTSNNWVERIKRF